MLLGQKITHSGHQMGNKMKFHYSIGNKINNNIVNGKSILNHIFNNPPKQTKSILER